MTRKELLEVIREAKRTGQTRLDLARNGLTVLPPEIGELKQLEYLDLTNNVLTALPAEIGELKQLECLDLDNNGLTVLPSEIGELKQLQTLFLSNNGLVSFPPEISELKGLRELYLSNNGLVSLPPEISELKQLQTLDLSNNGLVSFPPEISELKQLLQLGLSNNGLVSFPPEISELKQLRKLYLDNNGLISLPPEIGEFKQLQELKLSNNPNLISPPIEVVEQGLDAIRQYFQGLEVSSSYQWVSKMLVVGQGGVGKTSLLRALRNEEFSTHQDTTHGIEIGQLDLPHPTSPGVIMHLNTWDFAGQQIAHATHQFFLTNRSLFILAWNARHGFEQGKLYYWLETIRALAPESPVLLVATQIDERAPDLPITELRRSFPQIIGSYQISNKTNEGIDALRNAIVDAAARLPLMGQLWPTSWLNAANDIRSLEEKHLTTRQFLKRLAEHGVKDEDAKILMHWMHDLGDILHFRESDELSDTVILKPQWVTQYIAKVLESEEVARQKGIFTREEMDAIWDLDPTMQDRFLRMMEQFDLSYRTEENREISLVVERLPLDEADYYEQWDAIKDTEPCHELSMKFELSTIPAGVPTWYIARQHRFSTHTHWRHGVLFADDDAQTHLALTKALPHERHLWLTVRGPHPQNFFALLQDGIELTLARFPGLNIVRKVPCRCGVGNPCKHEYDYQDLLNRINKKPTIECPKSGEDVQVAEMLYGVEWSRDDAIFDKLERIEEAAEGHTKTIVELVNDQTTLIQREFLKQFKQAQSYIESECPNVFTLSEKKIHPLKKLIVGQKLELQLLCQYPGDWHPTKTGGVYPIDNPAEWLRTMGPYVKWLIKALKIATPFASPLLNIAFSESDAKEFETKLKLMEELVKNASEWKMDNPGTDFANDMGYGQMKRRVEGADLRALRQLLETQDASRNWGGLQKVLTPEGHYLWLCPHHRKEFKPDS